MADGASTQLLGIVRADTLQPTSANASSLSRRNPENGGFSRVLDEQANASSRAADSRREAREAATDGKSLPAQRSTPAATTAASDRDAGDRSHPADAGKANTGTAGAPSTNKSTADTAQGARGESEPWDSGTLSESATRESAAAQAEAGAANQDATAVIGQATALGEVAAVTMTPNPEGAAGSLTIAAGLLTAPDTAAALDAGAAPDTAAALNPAAALTQAAGVGVGGHPGTGRSTRGAGPLGAQGTLVANPALAVAMGSANPDAARDAQLLSAASVDPRATGTSRLEARPDLQAEALDRSLEFAATFGRGDGLRSAPRDAAATLLEGAGPSALNLSSRPGDLSAGVQLPINPLVSPALASPTGTAALGASGFVDAGLAHAPADPEFAGELTARMKMMLREGIHEARLQLNPAELGRLQVTISTEGDQARVVFVAENAAARDAIEQSLPRLRDMLEQAGLQLAQSDVDQRGFAQQPDSEGQGTADDELAERLLAQDADVSSADGAQYLLAPNARIDTYI